MLSKNQVKYLHSLRHAKFRDQNQVFLAEGIKLTNEILKSHFKVQQVFGTGTWFENNSQLLAGRSIFTQEVTGEELKKISNLVTPNEVLAVVCYPQNPLPSFDNCGKLALILDRIQDPGNLGTIIRTADWFGIKHIFCSEDSADIYNPKVIQSTMGSICRVNVHYIDIKKLLPDIRSTWHIYGTIPGGENIYGSELLFPAAVLIGNESRGIAEEHLPFLTQKIGIPSYSEGAESLNASVAAGIIVGEFVRRLDHGS